MTKPSLNTSKDSQPLPMRLGISQCLLGETVRYDGGHKRDHFLVDVLGKHVEWIPVCPEVEAGLGTPREAMRLVGDPSSPRLLTIGSGKDQAHRLRQFSKQRVTGLSKLNLVGYVFKKDSPSCGIQRVRVYNSNGTVIGRGQGLFAQAFQTAFPLIPVEEEGRLQDLALRENFIERLFGYHRWQLLTHRKRFSRGALVDFHAQHKYLLLAHSRSHYQQLGRLVGDAKSYTVPQVREQYGQLFMEALKIKSTVRKHVNVLVHMAGHLKTYLGESERTELHKVIQDYHQQLAPLTVPLTLIKHYVRHFELSYLQNQTYLNPHPKEL
ncbi:MAG: DUF523 and DUF1722 domain-containing protein, partial [Nitrospirota bacterium]|nr:DUF523 and DUF1722 domain-containing protein [Nitrospirota bacterium]